MKRRVKKKGQALIEYAFLLVLLATITFAVIVLAGSQVKGLYDEVSFEFGHLLDSNTYTQSGTVVPPGQTPAPGTCSVGQTPYLRGHKWKCN